MVGIGVNSALAATASPIDMGTDGYVFVVKVDDDFQLFSF